MAKADNLFFDYLPIKYEATEKEWQIRQLIWDFKDGRRSGKVAELVARQIRAQFGSLCDTITFACIPACTAVANAIRYEEFAEEVCRLTGATNAYKAITIEGERLAVHENQNGKILSRCISLSLIGIFSTEKGASFR